MSNLEICNCSRLKIPITWLMEVPKSWLLHFMLIFSTLRLYKITQEAVSHKLCVLPLKLCIKYLNDLHFAHSSFLRTRGDYYITWSRHTLNFITKKYQLSTKWKIDLIQQCMPIIVPHTWQSKHATCMTIIVPLVPIEEQHNHAYKA
jgi:hypothetical protein